jgi:LuxR family maltose regulon positive regulatory protein
MSIPILATKLYIPPPRPKIVLRPHLIERLNEGPRLGRKLTLISAPAGFGKTTLLSEWVHAISMAAMSIAAVSGATPPIAVAWLSLDEGDNDLARFLNYFVAALQTIEGEVGHGLLKKVRGLGMPLLSVIRVKPDQAGASDINPQATLEQ